MTGMAPIKASGIILSRAGSDGKVEIYLTKQPSEPPSIEVYDFLQTPVVKSDCDKAVLKLCSGLAPMEARQTLGNADLTPGLALGFWVAGIRGLFEQLGILLCAPESARSAARVLATVSDNVMKKRGLLVNRAMGFLSLLESEGLRFDTNCLSYFSHWLTEGDAQEFWDTRYFLTSLPRYQLPQVKPRRGLRGKWMSPEDALERLRRGSLSMTFATFASVRSLADFDSWDRLALEYGLNADSRSRA